MKTPRFSHSSMTCVLMYVLVVTNCAFVSALAAVVAGSELKEWPANPAKHQVLITREAADARQTAMIATAEAILPTPDTLRESAAADDRNTSADLTQPKQAKAPEGEKVWWYKELLGIRIPCAVTGDAVAYFADLVKKFGGQAFQRHVEPSSRLSYQAGVKVHADFEIDGKKFRNVHVVTLKLTFDQTFAATGTEGMHFEKERRVVFDPDGKVLHLSGDGPTDVPILAI